MIVIPDGPGDLGPVDEKQIESVYAKLSSLRVELDPNPLELGPARLNEKIAVARAQLSTCEDVFSSLSQALHRYRRALRKAETDYKLQYRHMLTNDVEVRGGRASSDREAIAATKLRGEVERVETLKGAVEDLEAVMTVVKAKREDLKDVQRRLKDQQQMCREEISLGGRWGSSPRGIRPSAAVSVHASSTDEVQRMMDDLIARGEVEEAAAPEREPLGPPPEEVRGTGGDLDYDQLLGEPSGPLLSGDEDDGVQAVLAQMGRAAFLSP